MEPIKVNLFDRNFIHTENMLGYITSSDKLKPKKIIWLNGLMEFDGVTVFTETYLRNISLIESVKSKYKVLWLIEPPVINFYDYNSIANIEDLFDLIITYDQRLLGRGNKYVKYVVGQTRIFGDDVKIHEKTELVSMIASNKTITDGHKLRHEVYRKLYNKRKFDMWGSGYRFFKEKTLPLSKYYFSISIMNSKIENFFTEILVDNFRVGTVPIFWGCPNIGEYFDEKGIITFNTVDELDKILSNLSFDLYETKIESIKNNLLLSEKYVSTDDIIGDIIKEKLL